jgi:hypothetical protein
VWAAVGEGFVEVGRKQATLDVGQLDAATQGVRSSFFRLSTLPLPTDQAGHPVPCQWLTVWGGKGKDGGDADRTQH